jgi:beta-lactam-binding protein with PASTA domain
MYLNRRPNQSSALGMAALAMGLLMVALAAPLSVQAQDPPFATPLPMCYVQPSPMDDTWPQAVTDSLGSTAGVPVTFAGATLVANDTASVMLRSVGSTSSGGGTITGTDPFIFTPAPGFIGADVFPYEIGDAMSRTTTGLVKVSVTRDLVLPSVSISTPLGGDVAGDVTVRATASDNISVTSVTFFDGAVEIGPAVAAEPFEAIWHTTLVADGSHTLSAVARDPAGNAATAVVTVDVRNVTTAIVPGVVGLAQASAVAAITGAGLIADSTNANSATAAIGTVISQNPSGGNTVAAGSSVALVVSIGALVPDVVGSTQAAATTAITAAGLMVGTVTETNNAAAAGSVISQSLLAGTSVAPGTAMALTVSLGPAAPTTVVVPGVVNQTQAAATTAITGAGLTLGAVTTASSSTVASGSVISQNPVGGVSVAPGSAVALVVSSGPPAPVGVGGLVLAFGFEEASGNPVVDSSTTPTNGTILGATRVANGKIGRALSFDGVNDWVTVTDTTASKIDLTNGMTVEAWVNPTAMAGWETVVMKERGAFGTGFLSYALYAHDGAPQAGTFAGPAGYLRPAPAASTTDQGVRQASHTPLALNTWTHLATTYDGANQRLYVNGVLIATRAQTGNIAVGNQPLRIGGNNVSGEFFQGLIDEVRIYNRALSAAEITADMTTPVVP